MKIVQPDEMAEKQQSSNGDMRETEEELSGVSEELVDALVKRLEAGVTKRLQKTIKARDSVLGEH